MLGSAQLICCLDPPQTSVSFPSPAPLAKSLQIVCFSPNFASCFQKSPLAVSKTKPASPTLLSHVRSCWLNPSLSFARNWRALHRNSTAAAMELVIPLNNLSCYHRRQILIPFSASALVSSSLSSERQQLPLRLFRLNNPCAFVYLYSLSFRIDPRIFESKCYVYLNSQSSRAFQTRVSQVLNHIPGSLVRRSIYSFEDLQKWVGVAKAPRRATHQLWLIFTDLLGTRTPA